LLSSRKYGQAIVKRCQTVVKLLFYRVVNTLQLLSYRSGHCSAAPHGCEASKFSSDKRCEFSAARRLQIPRGIFMPQPLID